jgi:histidinol-phosphate aminotransferase
MNRKLQPKPWISSITAYLPGAAKGADGRAMIKLSANENPLGCSAAALAARNAASHPAVYPDPSAALLREAIGELHGFDPAQVICGTGSDELLNLAAQCYAGPGDEILFSRHSFVVYEIAARRIGAEPVITADRDYGADIDAMIAQVSERTKVVFLANPNNPTGSYVPRAELARLHSSLPSDVLLVVDQAYGEYLDAGEDDGALELAKTADNVLVTRTFSKIYGLAGERVGWAVGAADIIYDLHRIRGPFNVTLSGQAAALAAIRDQAFVAASREHNKRESSRFTAQLQALSNHGLRALPSKANFVMVLFEGALSAEAAQKQLNAAGFAVRHFAGGLLDHCLRITIGTAEHMDQIAAILRDAAERAEQ